MGGMSQLVRDAARLLAGPMLTGGAYLVFYGHVRPGGALAGGLVAAGGLFMVLLACGREEPGVGAGVEDAGRAFAPLGGLLLALLACVGLSVLTFMANRGWPGVGTAGRSLLGGGTALLADLAVGLEVWMGLALVLVTLAAWRRPADGGGR